MKFRRTSDRMYTVHVLFNISGVGRCVKMCQNVSNLDIDENVSKCVFYAGDVSKYVIGRLGSIIIQNQFNSLKSMQFFTSVRYWNRRDHDCETLETTGCPREVPVLFRQELKCIVVSHLSVIPLGRAQCSVLVSKIVDMITSLYPRKLLQISGGSNDMEALTKEL